MSENELKKPVLSSSVPSFVENRAKFYPENSRRLVNKILLDSPYFQFVYNLNDKIFSISSKGDIVYSAIPYDTARNYLQMAAIKTILYPKGAQEFIEMHKPILENYLSLAIYQNTGKKVKKTSKEVNEAYDDIFHDVFFEIQVIGRLLQHDETGPLSASLPGKFLYQNNQNSGISAYLYEYIKFVIEVVNEFPVAIDGRNVQLIETSVEHQPLMIGNNDSMLDNFSDIKDGIHQLVASEQTQTSHQVPTNLQPILRSEYGQALSQLRKNYVAHSVNPSELEQYFENVLPTENTNLVNVVSDIHTQTGGIPFNNSHFNILAGDISDSVASDAGIKGIYVLGNHELIDTLPEASEIEGTEWEKYSKTEWFQLLQTLPDFSWPLIPVGDSQYYELVKNTIQERFPSMIVLNNESMVYQNVRYIGLTIPVALVNRKKALQNFIFNELEKILSDDESIPTVIVSHAPLFNELSMLRKTSHAYNRGYNCADERIVELFKKFNIIGVIHGHHHIPASFGRIKYVKFAGKQMFVVCSIYSQANTGIDLVPLIEASEKGADKTASQKRLASKNDTSKNKSVQREYLANEPIENIPGLSIELRGNKTVYRLDKKVNGKRNRKSFHDQKSAVSYLNDLLKNRKL
ncbi:metallophosphoesterase [Pseudolactococcus hodotermopsidis]|nr:metallophosphoesterase [Lactococcus hodotermopsidis]